MDINELLLFLLFDLFFSALSLLPDSSKHSGSSTDASNLFFMNHVGAHQRVDKRHFSRVSFSRPYMHLLYGFL